MQGHMKPAEADSYVLAQFTSADADKDSALNFDEFTCCYARACAPRLCDQLTDTIGQDKAGKPRKTPWRRRPP